MRASDGVPHEMNSSVRCCLEKLWRCSSKIRNILGALLDFCPAVVVVGHNHQFQIDLVKFVHHPYLTLYQVIMISARSAVV